MNSIRHLIFSKCIFAFVTLLLLTACSNTAVKSDKAADVNANLGILYLQKGRLQLANEKLTKALEQNPNSPVANNYYALLQQRLGDKAKARKHYSKAISLRPKDPEIRNNYGSFLCDNGNPKGAIKQFTVAINDPLYATPEYAYTNAGICLRKTGDHNGAEKYFRNALRKKSAFPSALLEMSALYADRKNFRRAQAFMLRYETIGKSTPQALELCSRINKKMGDYAKAENCTSALRRLFPESVEAQRS